MWGGKGEKLGREIRRMPQALSAARVDKTVKRCHSTFGREEKKQEEWKKVRRGEGEKESRGGEKLDTQSRCNFSLLSLSILEEAPKI